MTTPFRNRASSAQTTDIAGHPVTMHYGNVSAEYEQLRSGSGAVDHDARGRLRIEGPRAAEMLNGMVTNEIAELPTGRGVYAAALTPKGKIVADLRIHRVEDEVFHVDAPMRAHSGWMAMVRKYVNPRLAPYKDVSADTTVVSVTGAQSRRIVARALETSAEALGEMPSFSSKPISAGDVSITVFRVPELWDHAFELLDPAGGKH